MFLGRPQDLREAEHMPPLGRLEPWAKLSLNQQGLEAADALGLQLKKYLHGNQWEPKPRLLKTLW